MKNFRIVFTLITIFCTSLLINAQTKTDWKEKTEFHKVMSQTFHPAEEGNFVPIRSRIDELQAKAIAFKNSTPPEDLKNKTAIKKSLKKLLKNTKSFNKKIKSGAKDADLKEDFIALHDVFHEIVGLCNAEEEHNH